MADRYLNHIGGKWMPAGDGEWFENRNPADTNDLIGLFPKSSKADVDAAVQAASDVFDGWRLMPAPKRGEMLYRLGEILAGVLWGAFGTTGQRCGDLAPHHPQAYQGEIPQDARRAGEADTDRQRPGRDD
jgi:acyl-CoA reductase-like NAD-dependent aldehyde dehydrogenase